MVHWLDDATPLQSGGDQCAVLMRRNRTGLWAAGVTVSLGRGALAVRGARHGAAVVRPTTPTG